MDRFHTSVFKRVSALLCAALLLMSGFCSCTSRLQRFTDYSFEYFDTATSIVGYAPDRESFQAVSDRIKGMLEEYHKLYNIYYTYDGINNLCTLNKRPQGTPEPLRFDGRILELLSFAKEIYALTGGKTNIAMGSVLSLWHTCRTEAINLPENARLPEEAALQAAAEHTRIDDLLLDPENGSVALSDPEMTLDVGAIGKGYAVEQIARQLEREGISGYLLNVGGNVRAIGCRGDGKKWTVGIEKPTDGEEYFAILSLDGQALVTSGSYQRFYIYNGKSYHHIIDPDTLYPAEYFLSVSVVCGDSGLADGLSTALFSMPLEEGMALIERLPGVEALWVTPDGKQFASDGFSAYLA